MSSSRKKVPPPIPVIGAATTGSSSRENELLAWEEEQQRIRAEKAAAAAPVPVPVAPAAEAVVVPAQPAVASSSTPAPTSEPAAAGDAPASEQPANLPELPPDTAPASEILSRCEQVIIAARVEAESKVREVEQTYLATIGPWVRLVHRTKAYKELKDANGRPFRSFERWAQERCGISRAHAYRAVDEGPVAEALAPVYAGPLAARQVGVLAPILRQHSADGVRSVWQAAAATGNTGAAQLAAMRDVLELGTQPEEDEVPGKKRATSGSSTALLPVLTATRSVNREEMRRAAAADPEAARNTVLVALRFASDLQHVLEELNAE